MVESISILKSDIMKSIKDILIKIMAGTSQIIPQDQLIKKLESGEKLKIKLGMDPTSPDLHLGHAVVLEKMKDFQDLGHEIIFLIGDFTAKIGDPTGKSKTRPPLTDEEISKNTKTYFEQVSKILDPDKVKVRYNSEWLSKLSSSDLVKLCAKVTLSQLIEREDFKNRIKNNQPISMHELLYPLFQGYDSVALNADIELGGTDQTFNLLMGRTLQERFGQEQQVIITMPILEGLDGVAKMSKSLGNYIGLIEQPNEAYGKLMSISDQLMWRYYELLLRKTNEEIHAMKHDVALSIVNPINLKKEMAYGIISKFWSKDEAEKAQQNFENIFQKKDLSQAQELTLPEGTLNPIWIVDLLRLANSIKSSSDAKRLIGEGAVKINNNTISDFQDKITLEDGMQLKIGKHKFFKIKFNQ